MCLARGGVRRVGGDGFGPGSMRVWWCYACVL